MNLFTQKINRQICLTLILVIIFSQISACSFIDGIASTNINNSQLSEVIINAEVLDPLPGGSKLMLEILDDVTGLYFNSSRFKMAKQDDNNYSLGIPLKSASEIKYRYVRVADGSDYEYDSRQQQVRFRILRVDGPQNVNDTIAAWRDMPYSGPIGRITGQVIDGSSHVPLPNMLITAGGEQTISASDGTFILNGLVPGVHNLVIYSMDGAYQTFQQGALIAEAASTPVQVYLIKRATTRVKFIAAVPLSMINETMPLRFVSNMSNLGNAYADLSAGSAGSAVNYPVLTKEAFGRYSITLELPVGAYLRYKYSFGDGFWNAELSKQNKFVVRDLLVPENGTIRDLIQSFSSQGFAPVKLNVKVPASTPEKENVFIQFNPFGWTEPIPMQSVGNDQWTFTVYSPLHFLDSVAYRFCRNGQCDFAGESAADERNFNPLSTVQTLTSTVINWQGLSDSKVDASKLLLLESVKPRPDFLTGVELSPSFPTTWRSSIDEGLTYSQSLGGDWVILSPTWTVNRAAYPDIQAQPGKDLLWNEVMTQINHITVNGQKTLLFPKINYAQNPVKYWGTSIKDDAWWLTWYDQYQRLLFNYADLAKIMGVDAIILGDPSTLGAIGAADVPGDIPSASPSFASRRWNKIISGVRERYSGTVIGVVSISNDYTLTPEWLDKVDLIYVLFSPSLSSLDGLVSDIKQEFDTLLSDRVKPITEQYGKPVIIGLSYPSNMQAASGFEPLNLHQESTPADAAGQDIDLETQAKIYSAAILSASSVDWISGFISRGYYPYVELQDASSSIYRKPAAEILWFWFHYLLNKAP